MHKELRFTAPLAALLLLGGCAGYTTSEIDAVDRSVAVPSVRVAVDLGRGRATEEIPPPARVHTSHALELGLSYARGSGTQHFDATQQPITFGGRTFVPPQDLHYDFDLRFVELAYRYRHLFSGARLGVEGLAGAGYADLGLTVNSATQRASERLRNGGLVLGLGGLWGITSSTSLHARGTLFYSGASDDVTNASRFEIYLAQALGRNVSVRAGYATWSLRSERESDHFFYTRNSPLRVRFSGPALGLELMF
ncbi:MAG: hypothetical protein QOD26_8 [Betaproteobacteria bacterium]|jgi:hypothetical protein|nr:hypothetical protein [Betaproteobacteria bacterium]